MSAELKSKLVKKTADVDRPAHETLVPVNLETLIRTPADDHRYTVIKSLQSGLFGNVVQARDTLTGKTVAIKVQKTQL